MDVSDLTEDQAKAILDILAKRMGLEYSIIKDGEFRIIDKSNGLFYVYLSSGHRLFDCSSYIKALKTITSSSKDKDTTLYIPGTTVFHAVKCPSLEELLIQIDIA